MTGNVVLDDFDDLNALGQEHGVSFVATPGGYGLAFSETTESRIVYPYASGFPRAGTLEMTVNVDYGYSYSYGNFAISEQHALLFTTDIQSGDYTWPGSAWLFGFADGRLLFHIAGEKDVGGWAPAYRLWVTDTEFRFDEWHTVGISYGSAGMVIAVDGTVVGTLPTNTQQLAGGGTPYASLDQPTIGESVSGLGYNNLFEGGFNGVVEAIRYSDTQSDWALDVPPPTASLSISDAIVTEGGTLQFTVTRSGSTDQAISAYYQAFDGTADGALSEDYTTAGGYLTIAAGETTAVIEIATSYDEIVEGDETVVVRLSDPTTAITDGEAIGTIEDNDQLLSTAELFTEHGKLVTLAMLANAAYHLHEDEVVWTGYNDDAPAADALYDTLATELQLLDADDLPSLAPLLTADTFFPVDGLVDGIYTSNNGAALLARSTDALFVSFRGTNDFSAIGLFPTPGATAISPDIEDWNNKGRHYGYFAEMVDALHDYVAANPEIQVVYVTGHSLGGGMVQPFVSEAADWGVAVDATTFASPGFNDDLWPFDESSTLVSNYWNVLDPIRAAAWTSEIHGGHNIIDNGLSNPFGAMTHHSMDLYLAEIRFLHEQLPELTSRELVLNGIDYSRILMQVVEGQGGNFLPGIAADELTGSNDDEIVLGGAGNDVINAGGGNDLVLAGAGDDLVSARDDSVNSVSSLIADDIFDGVAGIDTFDLSTLLYPGDPGYTVSLDPTAGYAAGILIGRDALRNFENLIATRYDDHITGNDVQNRLEGRDGADTLIGLGGSDVLIGGKGDDRLEGGSESDTYVYLEDADTILEAGGSADVIQFDPTSGSVLRANVSFTANSGHDLIITIDRTLSIDINETITILDFFHGGPRVVESLTFTDGSTFDLTGDIDFEGSWLFGTSGDNQLTGVGSTDTVSYDSSVGSVRIDLDSSNSSPLKPASRMAALTGDSLVGYAAGADIGTDTLIGVENAVGGLGNDILIGSRYANVLDGEAGRDLLIGEGGKDFLIGGSGADEFSYFSVLDSRKGQARDVIEDFQRRADDIDLSALDASLDRAGNQAFKWIGSKAFTGKAGELHYVKKAGFILVEGDIDGNGKADFQIQLDDIAAIGKGDFIL